MWVDRREVVGLQLIPDLKKIIPRPAFACSGINPLFREIPYFSLYGRKNRGFMEGAAG